MLLDSSPLCKPYVWYDATTFRLYTGSNRDGWSMPPLVTLGLGASPLHAHVSAAGIACASCTLRLSSANPYHP